MKTEQLHSIELVYREGSSDKVYRACVEAQGSGFLVNFAYGRRGATLNTGTKTQQPVPYDEAVEIYDKLVKSKTAKGYKLAGGGPAGGTGIHPIECAEYLDRVRLLYQLEGSIDPGCHPGS